MELEKFRWRGVRITSLATARLLQLTGMDYPAILRRTIEDLTALVEEWEGVLDADSD